MTRSTEQLIEELTAGLQPVRRLWPWYRRSAVWLGLVLSGMLVLIAGFGDLAGFAARMDGPRGWLELAGILFTGITAVLAAFRLSVPGDSGWWPWAPLPPLLLWLGSSGYGCYREWLVHTNGHWAIGDSLHCFSFIVGVSLPLSGLLFWTLRRARPLAPLTVAAMGALGVAGLAAFLLEFFHPFDITLMDLVIHLSAMGLVIASAALLRHPILDGGAPGSGPGATP